MRVRGLSIMRIVLTGASGQLGTYLLEELVAAGHRVWPWSGRQPARRLGLELRPVDLTDEGQVLAALREADPELILHTAAMSAAEEVRKDPRRGQAVNVDATRRLAGWCGEKDRRLVYTSTDMVFDGTRSWYREDDEPRPILAYGRTKAEAEPTVLAVPGGLVARLSLLYGPSRAGRDSFFDQALAALRNGQPRVFFEDEFRTPLDYRSAARSLVRLAEAEVRGIVHVAGRERVSRFELMRRVAAALGIDPALVRANRLRDTASAEPRPADLSLDTTRLASLVPDLDRPSIEAAVLEPRDPCPRDGGT
jgi:dTDP-4-dehydrorhamnose reductase